MAANQPDFAERGGDGEKLKEFDISSLFNTIEDFQTELDEDSELRESLRGIGKEMDRHVKKINFVLLDIHRDPTDSNMLAIGTKATEMLKTDVHPLVTKLEGLVPKGRYYKYIDTWRHTFQRLAGTASVAHFLIQRRVCSMDECCELLAVATPEKRASTGCSLMIDYEDYLVGLLDMSYELSRFTRNCVTFGGSLETVFLIHKVMNQLNTGLHNITFKNDFLRRKYDGLKYNLKNVEEVVYDIKTRDLEKIRSTPQVE